MTKEKSLADLDCQVLTTCGTKASVVNVPANNPKRVRKSIVIAINKLSLAAAGGKPLPCDDRLDIAR